MSLDVSPVRGYPGFAVSGQSRIYRRPPLGSYTTLAIPQLQSLTCDGQPHCTFSWLRGS